MSKTGSIFLPGTCSNTIRTQDIQLDENVRGLGEELYKAMSRFKNRIAQIYAETGESETFATILERSVRVAVNLKRLGVTPDDILTPCTDNHLNTAVTFIATILTGAKVASIDPFAPDEDRMKQLAIVKPKIMFCSLAALERAENMLANLKLDTQIIVFGQSKGYMSFDDLLDPNLDEEKNFAPFIPKSIFETAVIVFSSGTTGDPHAICLHNYGLLSLINSALSFQENRNEPLIVLIYSSLVWITGVMNVCCSTLYGDTRVVASIFTSEKTWEYIHRYKVTSAILVCPHLLSMADTKRPVGIDTSSLKTILTGGTPISGESILKIIRKFPGVVIILAYAQTEMCGGGTAMRFKDANDITHIKSASVGLPVFGSQIKIVHPDTEEVLGPNQVGEFRVKSIRNMNGYYNEDSSACYDLDGFLKTGDLMRYDEDGYFYFVERLKEVLRYQLYPINPSELENVIREYPGVEFAVVIGLSSEAGDLPVGVVVRNDKSITEDELQLFLSKLVDERKKLHGGIKFVERSYIPFTPSGKVNRRRLRAKISNDFQ